MPDEESFTVFHITRPVTAKSLLSSDANAIPWSPATLRLWSIFAYRYKVRPHTLLDLSAPDESPFEKLSGDGFNTSRDMEAELDRMVFGNDTRELSDLPHHISTAVLKRLREDFATHVWKTLPYASACWHMEVPDATQIQRANSRAHAKRKSSTSSTTSPGTIEREPAAQAMDSHIDGRRRSSVPDEQGDRHVFPTCVSTHYAPWCELWRSADQDSAGGLLTGVKAPSADAEVSFRADMEQLQWREWKSATAKLWDSTQILLAEREKENRFTVAEQVRRLEDGERAPQERQAV